MIRPCLRELKTLLWSARRGSHSRRDRQHWVPEGLEDRVLLANPTHYTVDLTSDTGAGSGTSGDIAYVLYFADNNSNSAGSLIQFDPKVFGTPRSITLQSSLVLSETAGPIVIDGPGANLVTFNGNNTVEVFQVDRDVTATLSGLTITGGQSNGSDPGGGIVNNGALTVNDSSVVNNDGDFGGGIDNGGTLTITNSTVAGNSSTLFGGGIDNEGTVTAIDSTFASNWAFEGGGGISNDGGMTIVDCTIANNASNGGGGIANFGPTLTVVNSTIAYNAAVTTYELTGSGSGNVVHPGNGGGLAAYSTTSPSGGIGLYNTIVALNTNGTGSGATASDILVDGGGLASSSSYNLVGTGGSGSLTNGVNGNQVGVANPGLETLASNGGPTQTIALEYGSPAINAGSNALDGGQATDQRGDPRISGGTVDVGAYEFQFFSAAQLVHNLIVYWGTDGSDTIQLARDGISLLPVGRKNDLPWYGIDRLEITLSQSAVLTAADVMLKSAKGINYGPVMITGMGMSYTIMFAQPIDKADRITLTVNIPETDMFVGRLNVLPGDVNGDEVVNSMDFNTIKNEWRGKHGSMPTIYGDIIGNGTVNAADYNAARMYRGMKLPKLEHLKAMLVRAQAKQRQGVKGHD